MEYVYLVDLNNQCEYSSYEHKIVAVCENLNTAKELLENLGFKPVDSMRIYKDKYTIYKWSAPLDEDGVPISSWHMEYPFGMDSYYNELEACIIKTEVIKGV